MAFTIMAQSTEIQVNCNVVTIITCTEVGYKQKRAPSQITLPYNVSTSQVHFSNYKVSLSIKVIYVMCICGQMINSQEETISYKCCADRHVPIINTFSLLQQVNNQNRSLETRLTQTAMKNLILDQVWWLVSIMSCLIAHRLVYMARLNKRSSSIDLTTWKFDWCQLCDIASPQSRVARPLSLRERVRCTVSHKLGFANVSCGG